MYIDYSNEQFKDYVLSLSNIDIENFKNKCDEAYYNNSKNIINDWQYDILYDIYKQKFSNKKIQVGCKLRDKEIGVILPYWLGSMDKVKTNNTKIYEKLKSIDNNFITSDKLDGISCLLIVKNNNTMLYTRGDGIKGKDVTYIKDYINYIPDNIPNNTTVRGELIMSKNNFLKLQGNNSNARNTVSGIVKAKTIKNGIDKIDFIAYELIKEQKYQDTLLDQYKWLKKTGFKTVNYKFWKQVPNIQNLTEELLERRNGIYEVDGIIFHISKKYIRNTDGNPNYAFAFKEDTAIKTTVKNVLWSVSMNGLIKPRVEIEPVEISGAKIKYATGYNAAYIEKNKIGPGAIIEITRSGEVIPRILSVIKSAEKGKLPINIKYKWNDTKIDIVVVDNNKEKNIKKIYHFMKCMEVMNVSIETIRKLYDSGYDNIFKILELQVEDLEKIDRFKKKLAERTWNCIHEKLDNVLLENLMAGSCIFGFGLGKKKLKELVIKIPDIVETNIDNDFLKAKILAIEGFQEKTANKIIENIEEYRIFHHKISKYLTIKRINENGIVLNLQNKKIVLTGFRSKNLETYITTRGGKVTTSVSKNTDIVVCRDKNSSSVKIQKAKEHNVEIYNEDEFKEKYN